MSALISALKQLLNSDDGSLNASAFSKKQQRELEQFSRTTQLVTIRKKGRAIRYQLLNNDSVVNYIKVKQPLAEAQIDPLIPLRSKNIALENNSKKGQSLHNSYYLLMKAWDDSVLWQEGTNTLQPAQQTQNFGLAALCITKGQSWFTKNPLWFVENQALFDRCDWLPSEFKGCLIYYSGQLPKVLLNWLKEQKRSPEIVFFPDYDGVGLSNYVRLQQSLHSETSLQFYWMPGWEDKLEKFGNTDIWQKTRVQFENAIKLIESEKRYNNDFSKLARLAQFYGKTLEQEAIWLSIDSMTINYKL